MVSSINEYPWEDLRLFLAVAESGSFSEAARVLRIGQPTVSRRIGQLEEGLGQALFVRTAGGAVPTSMGERLLPAARRMAEAAAEASRLAAGRESRPEGLVRIAAPPGLAYDFVAPFAAHVARTQPGLRLEVLSSIAHLDLARGEADLALRTRAPSQRELRTLATLTVGQAAYASRSYAARLPAGYGLADVHWITWAPPYDRLPPRPQLESRIPDFRPVFTSDSFLVQWSAAEAGVGAMVLAKVVHRFARPSDLVELDLDLDLGDVKGQLHLVAAKSMRVVPRVRAMAELLLHELREVQGAEL